MPFESVYAQVSDLGSLASLGSMIQGANQDLISKPDGSDANVEEEKPTKVKQESNFEDENYGYTGGKSFVNHPQGKFFDEPSPLGDIIDKVFS